jgi:hypothetical protein
MGRGGISIFHSSVSRASDYGSKGPQFDALLGQEFFIFLNIFSVVFWAWEWVVHELEVQNLQNKLFIIYFNLFDCEV